MKLNLTRDVCLCFFGDLSRNYDDDRMGSHPSGPAMVEGLEGVTLKEWLVSHSAALGDVPTLFGSDIPFLFKVPLHTCCDITSMHTQSPFQLFIIQGLVITLIAPE